MTFDQWLQTGIDNKWIGPPVCSTHDGIPMSEQEENEWEQGNDPCHHILRLYEDENTADQINHNFTPYKWRQPQTPPPQN